MFLSHSIYHTDPVRCGETEFYIDVFQCGKLFVAVAIHHAPYYIKNFSRSFSRRGDATLWASQFANDWLLAEQEDLAVREPERERA